MATRRGKGEGTVYKRKDGRWEAVLTLATKGGKRQRRSFFGRTRLEAATKMRAAQGKQDNGLPLPSEKLTLATFLAQWLETKKPDMRPESYRRYEESVRLHINPEIGKKALAKLTAADLQACYARCREKGLSGTSTHHVAMTLRGALKAAMRWELVARNVADLTDAPRRSTAERSTLNVADARKLLEAAQGDPLEALWTLAITAGPRLGEMLGLQWADVDLDKATVRISHTLAGVKDGEPVLTAPKTPRSRREIKISAVAVEALRRHRAQQRENRLLVAQHWRDNGLVFCSSFGTPLNDGNVRARSFANLLEKACLPHMRIHDLRHCAASLMLAEGVNIRTIADVLGHSDVRTTLATYSHLLPGAQDAAAGAMDRIFGAAR